jgi:hypothetical protein
MSKTATIDRALAEIEKGRLWRAKDILGGSLSNVGYDLDHYACYGNLLLQMGDIREAGRFIFLSGNRESKYQEAISVYLAQFRGGNSSQIYSSFPVKARMRKLSEYPDAVSDELRRLGFDEVIVHPNAPIQQQSSSERFKIGCLIVVMVLLLILFVIGFFAAVFLGAKVVQEWLGSS